MRTTDFEVAGADAIEHFLVDAYGTSLRIRGRDGRRVLRHRRTDAGMFALESAHQTGELEFAVEPLRRIVVARTATSGLERADDRTDRRYDAGELFLLSDPDRPYTARWTPGEIQSCVLDPALLARVAAAPPGRRPGPIRFTGLDALTPAAAAQWWAARCYVAGLLADAEAAAYPLLVGSAAQLLAAATLATFPNTALTDPTSADRRDAHPASLRRAIAFIEENAHRDIAIADIAAGSHVGIRTVQLAFRRHLDMTPLQYLRGVRLSRAHAELRDAGRGDTTVTAVAGRWGFADHSRFAALYRKTYGTTPGRTLRENR